jgi:hypothetical protein
MPTGPRRRADDELTVKFQSIKSVRPYLAAILARTPPAIPSAPGLDVWNRKLLARRLLGVDDAPADAVMAVTTKLFPGHQGLAALYLIEHEYAQAPVVALVEGTTTRAWRPDPLLPADYLLADPMTGQ